MKLILQSSQRAKIIEALRRAGSNEIGGQLFGQQLALSHFLLSDVAVQARPGTFARFIVDLLQAAGDALRHHQYTRFNYIGEWHSHPSFEVSPSGTDLKSIRDLVRDPDFSGNFAVLMIVQLDGDDLSAAAWYFDPHGNEGDVALEVET